MYIAARRAFIVLGAYECLLWKSALFGIARVYILFPLCKIYIFSRFGFRINYEV